MGISRSQFWDSSSNGAAMIKMLAQRGDRESASAGDVELVGDTLDWLCALRRIGIQKQAMAAGRSVEAAKIIAEDQVRGTQALADSVNDRNVVQVAEEVIRQIFNSHYQQGAKPYADIMKWLADKLRERVKFDGPGEM